MQGTTRLSAAAVVALLVAWNAQAADVPPPPPAETHVTAEAAAPEANAAPVDVQALRDAIRVQQTELREQVSDAKERNYLAKMRLHTFNEEVLRNLEPPGGARLVISHRNLMASGFTMIGIAYALDGAQIYSKLDLSGKLDERGQIAILDAKVVPGEHQLVVQYDVKGNGGGFFSYLNDLRVQLRRAYNFKIEQGKETRLIGTLTTNNGFTELYQDRPIVGFETLVVDMPKPKTATAVAAATPPPEAKAGEEALPPGIDVPPPPAEAPTTAPSTPPSAGVQ